MAEPAVGQSLGAQVKETLQIRYFPSYCTTKL